MSPLHYHLIATGSWFASFGIQSVVFAWLLTIELHADDVAVGYAQMALTLPAMAFVLIAGMLADRFGGRRVALLAQAAAIAVLTLLLTGLVLGQLSYLLLVIYGLTMGTVVAFLTPSRDGLLSIVADDRIQRAVMFASLAQFGMQIVGLVIGSQAQRVGAEPLIACQIVSLAIGMIALARLPETPPLPPGPADRSVLREGIDSLVEGAVTVFGSPVLRAVAILNAAMGTFFMASYMVIFPLLIRDVYGGESQDLALTNAANSIGLVAMTFALIRFGDIHRMGRALVLSQTIGAFMLAGCGLGLSFPAVVGFIFMWGVCGGVAISMSRTLMQGLAPAAQRGRVMAFHTFTFMGAGPVGAVLSGYLSSGVGPGMALVLNAAAMLLVATAVGLLTALWRAVPEE